MDVRFVAARDTALIERLLPLIKNILATVGSGDVVATKTGLQITADVDSMPSILRICELYTKNDTTATQHVVYAPPLLVRSGAAPGIAALRELRIVPEDIIAAQFELDQNWMVFVFAGPSGQQGEFQKSVRPQIEAALRGTVNVVYVPGIVIPKGTAVKELISSLALCPPDMLVAIISRKSSDVILFSGPAERAAYYDKTVLPSVRAIVGIIGSDDD